MRRSHATVLVDLALREFELFHDRSGATFASALDTPRETFRLGADGFRRSLARAFFHEQGAAPSTGALASCLDALEGIAAFAASEHETFLRVAELEGSVYVDLADPLRRAVEIDRGGWRVVEDSPVRFLRPNGMRELPEPRRGGSLDELRIFLNVSDDESFRLLVGFLLGALHPKGPYPLLSLTGEQGSAKSTAAAFLRDLIDPNAASLRSPPSDLRDLAVATRGSWVLAFDNLSHISPELSDGFCRLTWGGAFATRRLYTDAEEVTFEARRPLIITSIPEVVTSPDLADRALTVTQETIPETERLTEAEVRAGFDEATPRLLGALYDAFAGALANIDGTRPNRLPRMADLARWVTAAEPAMGWPSGSFIDALASNRKQAAASALDGSLVGRYIAALSEAGGFTGTTTDLLARLEVQAGADAIRDRYWPRSPRGLSGMLRRLAPDLERLGITVGFERAGHEGRREVRIAPAGRSKASDGAVLPFAKPSPPDGPSAEDVAGILHACGLDETWASTKAAALALQKAVGNGFAAARALNDLGIPAPGGGAWTAETIRGVV